MREKSAGAGSNEGTSRHGSGCRFSSAPGRRSDRFCSTSPKKGVAFVRTIPSAEFSHLPNGGRSTGKLRVVKRDELEHVLRAAGAITGVSAWVIVGSQAILAARPDAPEELRVSQQVFLYAVTESGRRPRSCRRDGANARSPSRRRRAVASGESAHTHRISPSASSRHGARGTVTSLARCCATGSSRLTNCARESTSSTPRSRRAFVPGYSPSRNWTDWNVDEMHAF